MIKNYFRIALRNLFRDKLHSFINIAGLAIGMTIVLLIGLWIMDECTFDKYNPNYDHIARVMQNQTLNGRINTTSSMPLPLAGELRSSYSPAIRQVVTSYWTRDYILAWQEKKLTQRGKFMDAGAADMLSLNMLQGSRAGLSDPSSILLSESTSRALFGDADPLDRTLHIDNKMTVSVKGIYEDIPQNSQFRDVGFIAPFDLYASTYGWMKEKRTDWGYDCVEIFLQVANGTDAGKLSAHVQRIKLDHLKDNPDAAAYQPRIFLQPMKRWHLYSEFRNGVNTGGSIQFVRLFGTIGFFVLLLACINFMNLSTARSERRAKEVGIRKAIGSLRGQLISQFYSESLLVALMSFLLSLGLLALSLPLFNKIAGKHISVEWSNPWLWTAGIGFSIFTGLLAGSYPALYLSSFRAVVVLKGSFRAGRWAAVPRRALVVLQFSVSVLLVIGTIVVFRQIRYAMERPVGYDRNGLLTMPINIPEFAGREETLRQELLRTGSVSEMAIASSPANWVWNNYSGFEWPGKDPNVQGEFATISVSHGYGPALSWKFKDGRDFSRDMATDSSAIILNEAAVDFMNLKHPVGTPVTWDGQRYKVIGVVKNMIMESPYEPVRQTIYMLNASGFNNTFLFIRLRPGIAAGGALPAIRTAFQRVLPSAPFDYQWVDEQYAWKFNAEQRIGQLAACFAIFALFISALGIFGMASFIVGQRIREIGMRRVLGASVFSIWRMLSKEFILLVGLSFLIAGPVAWYCMHRWLQNYTYHSGIPWWIFAVAATGTLLITLATVSWQSISAAMTNPVKTLKDE
ncbi:MAG TPA: ABC transporter permease [Puia sp.]|nr:ABC transporter permease [Puia sp.]